MKIAVVTTFGNASFDVYAKRMLQSFAANWPAEIPLLVQLDDELLLQDVAKIVRPQDAIATGWEKDHAEFVERNKGKDDPQNYRKQPVRFCHKVFAIKRALDAVEKQKADGGQDIPRYLIWMDADVITNRQVTMDDIKLCLPKEGDAVAYMGRKDWDHSECGWLVFDLENRGQIAINAITRMYETDHIFMLEQWHDSWLWDDVRKNFTLSPNTWTNLTHNATGMDVWPQSPMGKWSTHYKGPQAKAKLVNERQQSPMNANPGKIQIMTQNAIPHEEIRAHIEKNQSLIKNWIRPCKTHDEEIVVVSAGPMLVAEDIRKEAGKKIVAVKHALTPLRKAGIKPWACILLDPRPHVADFIKDADPSVLWFVASQVNPLVTMELLARGCTVWGYHASVNAGEEALIRKQDHAIISGGSATATRGLYVLHHLGFSKMKLYGYDLCVPDKPDLDAKDDRGQPKFLEMSIGMNDPLYNVKRLFWSEPQLIAQFEEVNDLIKNGRFNLEAIGDGIVPFMVKAKKVSDLRRAELKAKIAGENPPSYMDLLNGSDAAAHGTASNDGAGTAAA